MTILFLWSMGRLHWGFISRQLGASAAQLAYPVPPPTTVVGAFMAALGRALGLRDEPVAVKRGRSVSMSKPMDCALTATLSAAAGVVKGYTAGYEEPARIIGAGYKGGGSYDKAFKQPLTIGIQEVMPVQAVGAAAAVNTVIALAWLLDVAKLAGCLGVEPSDIEAVAGEAPLLVHRVGSREGLYSALAGGIQEAGTGRDRFRSILYQRESCAAPLTGSTARLQLPTPPSYIIESYVAPTGPLGGSAMITAPRRPVVFRASRGCKAVEAAARVDLEGKVLEASLGLAYPEKIM